MFNPALVATPGKLQQECPRKTAKSLSLQCRDPLEGEEGGGGERNDEPTNHRTEVLERSRYQLFNARSCDT